MLGLAGHRHRPFCIDHASVLVGLIPASSTIPRQPGPSSSYPTCVQTADQPNRLWLPFAKPHPITNVSNMVSGPIPFGIHDWSFAASRTASP